MKPEDLNRLVEAKRKWTEPLAPEDEARGFKGWYASKSLPHFDAPGAEQFITYRLEDSMHAALRHQWEALLRFQDDLEKRKRIEDSLARPRPGTSRPHPYLQAVSIRSHCAA